MTTERPEPGSVWATACPDAYPADWFRALRLTSLPAGFSRFATDDEMALILGLAPTGTRTESSASGGQTPSRPASQRIPARRPKRRREAVRERFRDLSTFLRTVHCDLTPTQRAVWLAVYCFTENGRATVTQSTLARLGGVTVRAVQKAIPGLTTKGLLEVLEKGKPGRSSAYRYHLP